MSNSIIKNISWLGFGNFLVKPVWFIFILVVAVQVLGAEGYGVFTAVLFLAAIANTFSDMGLSQYTTREVARHQDQATTFFSTVLPAKGLISLLSFSGAFVIGILLGYDQPKLMALLFAGFYVMAQGLTNHCRAYYRAFERMQYEAFSVISEKVFVISLGLYLLLRVRTAEALLGGMALGMTFTLLLNIGWTHRHFAPFRFAYVDPSFFKKIFPIALPLGLASQFVVIYFRTDAVMIDAMVGESDAGLYGAAYRILEATVLTTVMVTTAVYPRLSRHFKAGRKTAFQLLFRQSAIGVTTIGLGITFILFVFPEWLMLLIKGDDTFLPAAGALMILAWVAPFMCMNNLMTVSLSAADDQRILAYILGCAALVNLLLNFIVIPRYSFYGACFSTLITEVIVTAFLVFRFKSQLNLWPAE